MTDDPYRPVNVQGYRLPDGSVARFTDQVSMATPERYCQEVVLMQQALGVVPDGIIGPRTREALRNLIVKVS